MDLDVLADPIEDLAKLVVIGVAQPDPGIGHVAGFDPHRGGPRGGEATVDDEVAVAALQLVDPVVVRDLTVAVGAQVDQRRGETP